MHSNQNYSPLTACQSVLTVTISFRYQRGRFYRGWGFGVGAFVIVTLLIVLSVSFSIRYKDHDESNNLFAPGDTRIISYSSRFCEGLTLSAYHHTTLYLLKKTPPLSGPTNKLTAEPPAIPADTYRYLYYYLHPNSNLNMMYCIESGKSVSFDLIKGKENFDSWKDDGDKYHSIRHVSITNTCPTSRSFAYRFMSGDTYYFAFDNTNRNGEVNLQAKLVFNRTEYLPNEVTVKDSCTISSSGSCTVSVPYNSDYIAMIEVGEDGAGAEDNIAISWSCNARVWLYVVIVLVPLFFVVFAMLTLCAVCIFYARHRSKNYSTLPAEATPEPTAVNTTTVTAAQTVPSAPPPINPDYNSAPPMYGSTHFTDRNPPPDYNSAAKDSDHY